MRETAPEEAPEEEGAGLVDLEASAGGAAWRRRVAPRHRAAVKTFFGTETSSGTEGAQSGADSPNNPATEDGR